MKDNRAAFEEMVSRPDDKIDLAKAALLIARDHYPAMDVDLYLEKLDAISERVRQASQAVFSPGQVLLRINHVLFETMGFGGNSDSYYDPRNSFLNEVIDRRLGIPITLSVLYMEVAKRAGLLIKGVGLPGHFLAKYDGFEGESYIDAYDRGRLLEESDVREMLSRMSSGAMELLPRYLSPVTNKQILTRILANLLGIFIKSSDYGRSLITIERMLALTPDDTTHIRDHGLLLAAANKPAAALVELRRYLELVPDAEDRDVIEERIKGIRQTQAGRN